MPLLAFSESGHRTVDALFAFVRGGALDSARQAAPTLIAQAEGFLKEKEENPIYACLAAYTLLKLGEAKHLDWMANLANWFPYLPDGAIVYGWGLLRAGQADKAPEYFRKALTRGVPMYPAGVRLLHEGLNFLQGLYPEDGAVREDAAQVNRLAAAANLHSVFTCLRLGNWFTVQGLAASS